MKKKNSIFKIIAIVAVMMCVTIVSTLFLSGCSINGDESSTYIVGIEKTKSVGYVDYYTVTYSNGTTSTITITNGKNGTDGEDGDDGSDVSITEIYNEYVSENPGVSYSEFLDKYLKIVSNDNSKVINNCLRSCMKIYAEFKVTYRDYGWVQVPEIVDTVSIMCGSAVVYKMDADYTYVLTNYHVIYSSSANKDNGSNIASKLVGYLYGSEGSPEKSDNVDDDGYPIYNYGSDGIEFEYVGGSIDYDIAVLKVETSKIKAINSGVQAVSFADDYNVGETAIAIGNPENEGISVTQGIVSVDNEFIELSSIDGKKREYRCIRIDTAIYGGSSGGGLFNSSGELIGITNAGNSEDQNINYAIPIDIVKAVAENVIYYNDGGVSEIDFGMEYLGINSKYVYNSETGYGEIKEEILVSSVEEGSIAAALELKKDDIILKITINGEEESFNRYFELDDVVLKIKAGDIISFKYQRDGQECTTNNYTVQIKDVK